MFAKNAILNLGLFAKCRIAKIIKLIRTTKMIRYVIEKNSGFE